MTGGAKSIGYVGSIMLLTNSLAGPVIALMPVLVHRAGWLTFLVVMGTLGYVSLQCAAMLLAAMRRYPGNDDFGVRVEFVDLSRHFLSTAGHIVAMICFMGYLALTLVSYIVQTAQVFDHGTLSTFGCAYGLEVYPLVGSLCGTEEQSDSPFGEAHVLPASFFLVALLCAPLAWLNLDDNVLLQWVAVVGLFVLASIWCGFLASRPGFPDTRHVFVSTGDPGLWFHVIGVCMFNFALAPTLPSWANEKAPEVPADKAINLSIGIVCCLYTLVGIFGALAYNDWNGGNLFTKLTHSGYPLLQATVTSYPIIQNLTTIPVLSILIKYNLSQLGITSPSLMMGISFAFPWLLGLMFYGGSGFQRVCEYGGLVFSLAVNFVVPIIFAFLSRSPHAYVKVPCD